MVVDGEVEGVFYGFLFGWWRIEGGRSSDLTRNWTNMRQPDTDGKFHTPRQKGGPKLKFARMWSSAFPAFLLDRGNVGKCRRRAFLTQSRSQIRILLSETLNYLDVTLWLHCYRKWTQR